MPTSSKRFGLDVKNDLELELRLRRIEGKLEQTAQSSDVGEGSENTQRVTNIPQVTGLRVTGKTPSAITLAWNQVRISDLRRYELWVAEDLAFATNLQKFNVASTEFQYSTISEEGGGGLTTVYAKVRARTRAGNVGVFSVVLNAQTGQAQTEDIAAESITSEKVDPLDPIKYSGLDDRDIGLKLALRGYIDGYILSNNATDSLYDIDISAGVARDSTNYKSLYLTSDITKQIDATYAPGTNNGGMASGVSLTADTWYHVFSIGSGSAEADVGFDTDIDATNLLVSSSISYYRRIGSIYVNSSTEIEGFFQIGNEFFWKIPVTDLEDTSVSTSEVLTTLSEARTGGGIPPDIRVKTYLNIILTGGSNVWLNIYDPTVDHQTPATNTTSAGGWKATIRYNQSDGDVPHSQVEVWSNTSQQIAYTADKTAPNLRATVLGWKDLRGKE